MSYLQLHWRSETLGKQVTTNVLLPDVGRPPFPVFYLLHGLSDDYSTWMRQTRIEAYAARYPMIVVMPDGFRGFYTKNANGPDYARYIGEELPAFVERHLAARTGTSAARCIGGLSMGGYGALRIALGYPGRYESANAHSGVLLAGQTQFRPNVPEWHSVFGDDPRGTDHDLLRLVRRAKRLGKLPRLLIDCGTDDFLYEENVVFHGALEKLKVPHTYREFPGAHNWAYWDEHVREALEFHAAALRVKPL